MIYTRTENPSTKLVQLVHYCVKVYVPTWFLLKQSSKLKDTPSILFQSIQEVKKLRFPEVINIVKHNIGGNAFSLLPENFLYAMVLSEEESVRLCGLRTILSVRAMREDQVEKEEPRKKIPDINWKAEHWADLIDLEDVEKLREPATTRFLSDSDILNFIEHKTKPDLPSLPSHSQSVERSVKLVSEASKTVYGFDNRHRSILTKVLGRKLRPSFMSKGHYYENYNKMF